MIVKLQIDKTKGITADPDCKPLRLYVNDQTGSPPEYLTIKKLLLKHNLPLNFYSNEFKRIQEGRTANFRLQKEPLTRFEGWILEQITSRDLKTKQEVRNLIRTLADKDVVVENQPTTLKMIFQKKIDEHNSDGRSSAEYLTCQSHLERYLESTHSLSSYDKESVSDFNVEVVKGFQNYLKNLNVKTASGRLTDNTIRSYLRQLRAIFNEGEISYTKKFFRGISASKPSTKTNSVTSTLLKVMWNLDVSDHRMIEWARNLAVLTYFLGGMNLIDILSLTMGDLEIRDDGNIYLQFVRTKTKMTSDGKKTDCYIYTKEIRKLLEYFKYDPSRKKSEFVFDLTPPCSELNELNGVHPSGYTSLWNSYASKYLTALIKKERTKLDPRDKYDKVGLKFIRITVLNTLAPVNEELKVEMRRALEGLGDTDEMEAFYVSDETRLNYARERAAKLLLSMGLSPEQAENIY